MAAVQDEQERIDAILKKLFFSPHNQLISEGTVFDPSVRCVSSLIDKTTIVIPSLCFRSLINEKDEED